MARVRLPASAAARLGLGPGPRPGPLSRRPRPRALTKADLAGLRVRDWCRLHGVPDPVPEYKFALSMGRRWRFDLAWPGAKVAIEFQGGQWVGGRHTRPKGFAEDCFKISTAVTLGWRVLLATHEQADRGLLLVWLEAMLETLIVGGESPAAGR